MTTITMTIDVTYDESKTSRDALAEALDGLLENAMSTPGILDEHGSVQVGSFLAPSSQAGLTP
jgi:hypothetical protein